MKINQIDKIYQTDLIKSINKSEIDMNIQFSNDFSSGVDRVAEEGVDFFFCTFLPFYFQRKSKLLTTELTVKNL